jgi:energy-converting hydrogenase A subunit M
MKIIILHRKNYTNFVKSFDIKLEKVRKILKKDLDQTDLVKLAHCAIEVANQKCGPQKRKHPESSATKSRGKTPHKFIFIQGI